MKRLIQSITLKKVLLIIAVCSSVAISKAESGNNSRDKKFERLKLKGDRKFEEFSYQDAIDNYKKALEIQLDPEVKLQLANCYRLLNDPQTSAKWYEYALEDGGLAPEDMLNYGQVLNAAGRYDESVVVLERYQSRENWVDDKVEGLKDIERFYRNEEAFSVSESIFNSEQKDFSPTYADSGVVFVTGRRSAGMFKPEYNWDSSNFLDLFYVEEGVEPRKVHRGINTRYHEGPATIFDNGQKMIFTRNNYLKKKASKSEDGVNMLKLFYAERKNESKWAKPVELPFNSDDYSTGHPTINSDGTTLYFSSDMPGGYGGVDIYKASFVNGVWGQPENLGPRVNTERDEVFPFLHNDTTLYFSSDGHEGIGSLDLFRVNLNDERKPRNLGYPINTNEDDFGITLRNGTNKGYFSSNREGGTGDDDIYEVIIFDYVITVKLVDKETREELTGDMEAYEVIVDDRELIAAGNNSSKIVFPALRGTDFTVSGISPEYLADSLLVDTGNESREIIELVYELPLSKLKSGEVELLIVENNGYNTQLAWLLEGSFSEYEGEKEDLIDSLKMENYEVVRETLLSNIHYDFDKYNIRSDAAEKLDKLVAYLVDHQELKVNFSAHTDVRGSNRYNEKLANRRVESAKAYLIEKGINPERILTESFGELKNVSDCDPCDEKQHQMNRRTEIRVLFK